MIFSSPDPASDPFFASALLDMQHRAFEIEAEFVGTREIPPLQEDLEALTAFRGSWVTAWERSELMGAAAWNVVDDVVEIDRVMVHPRAHRRGVASGLMERVIARNPGRELIVTTGRDNPPGIAMYTKHGFVPEGDIEPLPGLWLTRFRRPVS